MTVYRVYGYILVEVELTVTAADINEAKKQAKKFGSESWYCDIDEHIHPPATMYAEEVK